MIGLITGSADTFPALILFFLGQFGMGTIAGLAVGRFAAWAINRINLDYVGLYPLLAWPAD